MLIRKYVINLASGIPDQHAQIIIDGLREYCESCTRRGHKVTFRAMHKDPIRRSTGFAPCSQPNNFLTPREEQVLKLLAVGKSVKEAALVLNLRPAAVHVYKSHLMGKLGFETRGDLIQYAIREKIVEIPAATP